MNPADYGRGNNTALRRRIVNLNDAAQRIVENSDALAQRTVFCATSFLRYDTATRCCSLALCFHVVVVVELERFNDIWGYAVEPLMPDQSKVTFQTKSTE